jgi:hypothetical protein
MVLLRYRSDSGIDMMNSWCWSAMQELLQLTIEKVAGDVHLLYRIASSLHVQALALHCSDIGIA